MPVHGLFVESVDLRRLGASSGGNDFLGDRFDGCPMVPGEKNLGSLARKGVCDRAADRASGSIDHRHFVLQHHLCSPPLSLFVGFAFSTDQHPRTWLTASKTSSGDWSTVKELVQALVF